ncbi:hypothetical protein JRO89_XS03G0215100 [Xanthoceras sorbifolium]|uniref:Cation-transporting P-type ATPase C-terminal domain-containing protein n=1 Tax=Xanthoceras sorbifolium TaxID=99658 RepID=A0ABQ8IB25_9ROSI|nr:hypothetical protein JRO89_XS03G0215100 [Xanthoceras sorbifolium]
MIATASSSSPSHLTADQCQQLIAYLSTQLHQSSLAPPEASSTMGPSISSCSEPYSGLDDWEGNLLAQAKYQIVALLALQFRVESVFGVNEKVKDTLVFNTFVLCQVFNEFNARKLGEENIFEWIRKNKLFLGIILITILLQVAMVEFLNNFTNMERLNWGQWCACIGIATACWSIG